MRLAAPPADDTIRLPRLLRGASVAALCAAMLASPAVAQTADQQTPATGANQPSPTGAKAGPGTAGSATPSSSNIGAAGTQVPAGETPSADAATAATSDAGQNGANDVVVTGIRQSLANAQNIKRNSDTVVDAITASDIGALPDRSVTEALQRVPGVAINRFAGNNDPDHFSVEGSGVVVRGLNFVRSEFNGRDTFSAGVGGQAINFSDVPAELLGSVEVYKNATAEMIEGGLAGTVNLNTRKPFDNKGFHIGVDAEGNYGDFEKKWSPTGSLLVSDTWNTGIGRIGLLGDIAYSRVRSRADGIQITNVQTRDNTSVLYAGTTNIVCRNPLPGNSDTTRLPPGAGGTAANAPACGAPNTAGADGFADPAALEFAPIGGQFRTQDYDRKRDGQALAFQWQSNDEKALLTAQFLRTHTTNSWGEHTFETAPDLSEYNTFPVGCQQNNDGPNYNGNPTTRAECPVGNFTNYTYDANGLFQSGYITEPGTGYRQGGATASGSAAAYVPTGGIQQSLSRRQVQEENTVKDYGVNLKINPDNHWAINLDADYTEARHDDLDVSIFGSTFADEELDLSGGIPTVIAHKPVTLAASWATPSPVITKFKGETDAQYFQDPNAEFWRAAMDHIEHSEGSEYALKGDFSYKFDDGSFLNQFKFGARYAEREETLRYTTYNWGGISEVWSGNGPVTLAQAGADHASFYNFPNFFRGATPGPVGGYYYNGDLLNGYDSAYDFFNQINQIWKTTNGATAANAPIQAQDRAGVIPGTPFLPSEISDVNQQDVNAYGQLNFGSAEPLFGNVRLSGNVGVRYVNTNTMTTGSIGVPDATALGVSTPYLTRCATTTTVVNGQTVTSTPGGVCNLGPAGYAALQQFATGTTNFDIAHSSYTYWLPSANFKFGLSRDLVFRLAASKVLTRPDIANIRNYLTVGTDPGSGAPTATAGNPYLKPATAWQFDATLEWYFARVGSLTFDAFYKSVHNFFYQSLDYRPISNNGVTESILVRGPQNYDGYGKIKGVEVAYQQTFDFLPSFLSGLGVNANYSYIDSSGLPNSFLNTGDVGIISHASTITPGNLPLEGLSKHNVNATVFYEKGPISLRAAYNWRSRFLLTAADVIYPYTSIFNDATGQLDASAFININKYVKVGVQGVNLLNEVTKTLQAYTSDPNLLAPRSYFVNDRRYSFILRGNF